MNAEKIVARAADDVVAWNQFGCLSPHVIYVEHGGEVGAGTIRGIAGGRIGRSAKQPSRAENCRRKQRRRLRRVAPFTKCAPRIRRDDATFGAAKIQRRGRWFLKHDARFQLSCLNRFIYVKGVADLKAALQGADDIRGKVSTVGIAAPEEKTQELAAQLARWGATRICPLGQMQNPPLTWRHDGRPALGDLTWTDLEILARCNVRKSENLVHLCFDLG